jgi:hypothetical protein
MARRYDMREVQKSLMHQDLQAAARSRRRDDAPLTQRELAAPDVREALKRQAFASRVPGCDDHFEKSRPCPQEVYGVSDQYVVLDSAEKVETSRPELGELEFNFMVQGVTRGQAIGVHDVVDTVIEIQVMPFCIPLPPDKDYLTNSTHGDDGLPRLVANPAPPGSGTLPLSQTPYCDRVTLFFPELGRQSISDAGGRRHHFEFSAAVAPTGDRLELTPLAGHDTYVFTDPIQDVHGLTAQFYNPFEPLSLPADVLYGVTPDNSINVNFLDFALGANQSHNLAPGDTFHVQGLSTSNNIINRYANRDAGLIAGAGTTADNITTNPLIDVNPLGGNLSSSGRVNVLIDKNRIRIPLRLRRVVGRLTNYIAP